MIDSQEKDLRHIKDEERKSGSSNSASLKSGTHLLSVTSGKGGVGKSNFAINTAIILSGMKQKVLVIDADTNLANLDILLGIYPKFNLSDVITGSKFMKDIIVHGPGGIDILPGSSGAIEMIELESVTRNKLIDSFTDIESSYDYIIIDTGAGLTANIIGYVTNSDEAIVVTNPEPTSIADAYATIKLISHHNPALRIRLLVNMVESAKDGSDVFERLNLVVENFLNFPIEYLGYLPKDPNVALAVSRQVPFVLEYPRSAASIALKMSVRKLVHAKDRSTSSDRNLFSRLIKQTG